MFLPGRSLRWQAIAVVAAIVGAVASAQSLASAREAASTYLIQPGDTLMNIAGLTGVPLDRLVGLNGIKNPDLIIAGQSLQLQGGSTTTTDQVAATAPAPATGARYSVKAGDTLWEIAKAANVSFDALLKLNDLPNADKLSVGQQLALPMNQ
jgi:LysM repeat protein